MTGSNLRAAMAALVLATNALAVQADPLPNPPPKVLPDPSPEDSHDFPPAEATRGTADPGYSLSAVKATDLKDCTPLNPCAVPPPSRESVEALPRARSADRRG